MKLVKALWLWLQMAGAVLVVATLVWLGAQYAFQLKLLAVQTGSMRPEFRTGDALIMQATQASELKLGMVVSYHSSRNPRELVTHRVVQVNRGDGTFQTKGDALGSPDPTVRNSLLAGKVVAVLPGMGSVLNWLRTWPALIVCIYLPALALTISELIRLERHYARQPQMV